MAIGERIIALRKAAGLSQGRLASLLDVSRQAVSKWENEQSCPDTIKMIQLADVLNTDVEYLATGKHIEPIKEEIIIKVPEIQEKIVSKIIEKPIIKYVEKPVTVTVEKLVEKPVLKRVIRYRYVRNPIEYFLIGLFCFLLGVLLGWLL